MQIAIVIYTAGGLSGGYKKYLRRILPIIKSDTRVEHIDIYTPINLGQENGEKVRWYLFPKGCDFRITFWLKREISKIKPDIVFIPTARWINFRNIPTVVMVQNMEPMLMPLDNNNSLKECGKNIARYFTALMACRCADRVIALSNFVKKYLVEKWRINPDKIGVVYHGSDIDNVLSISNPLKRFRVKEIPRFIFTAGSIRPARGLEDSIKAMKYLKNKYKDLYLLIAGNSDRGAKSYKYYLHKKARKLEVSDRVFWMGHLNEKEMNWCYQNCSAFIMTSRVEACPNIALEAMSHGCISVSTDNPPMPEIFSDSAFYYNAGNSRQLAQQIDIALKMSKDQETKNRLAARAIAENFNWERTVRLTVNQFEKLLPR
ncbi:MAG: glycosyltransferase family 4 protein [Candidatus Helarchaeota archaeon]